MVVTKEEQKMIATMLAMSLQKIMFEHIERGDMKESPMALGKAALAILEASPGEISRKKMHMVPGKKA